MRIYDEIVGFRSVQKPNHLCPGTRPSPRPLFDFASSDVRVLYLDYAENRPTIAFHIALGKPPRKSHVREVVRLKFFVVVLTRPRYRPFQLATELLKEALEAAMKGSTPRLRGRHGPLLVRAIERSGFCGPRRMKRTPLSSYES
jgi:hypothetical protein